MLDDTEKNENNNESTNIIHSNDLAMQSAGELESELAKFRSEWKKELERENNVKTSQKESETQCPIRIVTTDKANSSKSEFMTKIPNASLFSQEDENLSSSESTQPDLAYQEPKTNEEKAKYLFEKGVLLEQQGRYYEGLFPNRTYFDYDFRKINLQVCFLFILKPSSFIECLCN